VVRAINTVRLMKVVNLNLENVLKTKMLKPEIRMEDVVLVSDLVEKDYVVVSGDGVDNHSITVRLKMVVNPNLVFVLQLRRLTLIQKVDVVMVLDLVRKVNAVVNGAGVVRLMNTVRLKRVAYTNSVIVDMDPVRPPLLRVQLLRLLLLL